MRSNKMAMGNYGRGISFPRKKKRVSNSQLILAELRAIRKLLQGAEREREIKRRANAGI
jgi:hypothetical protein